MVGICDWSNYDATAKSNIPRARRTFTDRADVLLRSCRCERVTKLRPARNAGKKSRAARRRLPANFDDFGGARPATIVRESKVDSAPNQWVKEVRVASNRPVINAYPREKVISVRARRISGSLPLKMLSFQQLGKILFEFWGPGFCLIFSFSANTLPSVIRLRP